MRRRSVATRGNPQRWDEAIVAIAKRTASGKMNCVESIEPGGSNMDMQQVVPSEMAGYFRHLAERVEKHLRAVPKEKVYVKPFAYGNSIGHLILHLTGNLNHYIGAGIAGTGYVRNRPLEFSDPTPPPPDVALARFREAIA